MYVAILLSADDVGLFEATPFRLARRADIRREAAEKLISMLADGGLIRLYEVDGKGYGFIPRFRQRLQIRRTRHPLPPIALVSDDEDAMSKIIHLASNPTVNNGESRLVTVGQPPEPEPEPEPLKRNTEDSPLALRAPVPFPAFDGENDTEIRPAVRVPLALRWSLSEPWGEDAEALGWGRGEIRQEAEKFRQYWVSGKGAGTRKTIKGWRQSWSNWLSKGSERK